MGTWGARGRTSRVCTRPTSTPTRRCRRRCKCTPPWLLLPLLQLRLPQHLLVVLEVMGRRAMWLLREGVHPLLCQHYRIFPLSCISSYNISTSTNRS